MAPPKKVLLFSYTEYGQANVVLATAYELLRRGCEVHIASFSKGETIGRNMDGRVEELNTGVYGPLPAQSLPAIFHEVNCPGHTEAVARLGITWQEVVHAPGVRGLIRILPKMPGLMCPLKPEEYMQGVESCVEIIKAVQPDIIVVDKFFPQPADACELVDRNFVQISPNTAQETLELEQPYLAALWKFPISGSGYPCPLPWYLIPLNIFLWVAFAYSFVTSTQINGANKLRKAAGIKGLFPIMVSYDKSRHYLIGCPRECDFPFTTIPSNVTLTGPMLIPGRPVSAFPALEAWLKRHPTVLVNLGSNYRYHVDTCTNMALAIRVLLSQNPDSQVLWKMKAQEQAGADAANAILSSEIADGRVRIEAWIQAEPGELLRSGLVSLFVHHGGANSYLESIIAGVPQIVLPMWFDLYAMAQRVEYHGLGIYASQSSAPHIDADELSRAMLLIMDPANARGVAIRRTAKAMAETTRKYGGRESAAERILALVEGGEFAARGKKEE